MDIYHLINQPIEQRNKEWESAFFHAFVETKLSLPYPEPQQGPDGWPYLMATIDKAGSEPSMKVLEWLSDKGIGLALNPQKQVPDYVFTYGMLWNYRERAQFVTESNTIKPGQVEFKEGQKVLAGPPSPEYLPEYVRNILRQFFADQGVKEMNILVMGEESDGFDLCFSLDSLGLPDKAEHRGICEAISWFLPGHYSLVLVKEQGLPQFHKL